MKINSLIVIPTFNERENIAKLIQAIAQKEVPADVLIVDDNSPDGTGRVAAKIAKSERWVHVLHRQEKAGLGKAYLAGFKWGIDNDYKKIISMDADFSHPVDALPGMIRACNAETIALGSRYVKGGRIVGWNWQRYLNSWGANFFTRFILRLHPKDATAGFKCYPVTFLRKIDLSQVQAAGYAFQVEMLLLAAENGFKIKEIPITFTDRVAGESKIQGELVKSARIVIRLAMGKKTYRQFIKFSIVGALNTLVDWGVFYLLLFAFRIDTQTIKQISKAISFVVSAVSNYLMNRVWTFRSTDKKIFKEISKFFIVAIGGLLINQAIFYLVTGPGHLRSIFGLILASIGATLWNFFLNKKWTFKGK